jgi:hypothetical protein
LVPPIGPPPAPQIFDSAGELFSISASGSNAGGDCLLYYSVDGMTPYSFLDTAPWQPTILWGDSGDFDEGYYKSCEVGNGIDYTGIGEFSNAVLVSHD